MTKTNGIDAAAILAGMNEVETAFYAKYKLSQHSRESKRRLQLALDTKGLNKRRVQEITTKWAFDPTHPPDACVRCGSSKVFQHNSESAKKKKHCLICGYVEGSKNSRFKLLAWLFGR